MTNFDKAAMDLLAHSQQLDNVIKKEGNRPQINIDHFEVEKLEENAKSDLIGKQKYEEDIQKRWENY